MKHSHKMIKKILIMPLISLLFFTATGCDYNLFNDNNSSENYYVSYDNKKKTYTKDEIMYDGPDSYDFDLTVLAEANIKHDIDNIIVRNPIGQENLVSEKYQKEIEDKYKAVLLGKDTIEYYTGDASPRTVLDYSSSYYYYETRSITDYSVKAVYRIDLDRNGTKEVVLKVDNETNFSDDDTVHDNLLMLHYYDGKVYANLIGFATLDYIGENGIFCEIDSFGKTNYMSVLFNKYELHINGFCYEYFEYDDNDSIEVDQDGVIIEEADSFDDETDEELNYHEAYMFNYSVVEKELFKKIEHYIRKDGEALSYPIDGVIREEDINRIF